ncbi:hypothetical protein [Delftia phage PhiW-14]|uniref:Uncharacterized protein n=1 Tax=Delftia phage PhiW-14 TaxID=665032 RepID=C9DG67_BPW14|nr:hypothetical protein DP-phiW-14_gp097 [Delftia phage PhiW-14]ACV50118.1 hypothetical protein [Delftia phage PhiW-14]
MFNLREATLDAGVPQSRIDEAMANFDLAKKIHKGMDWIGLWAPFVMLWVCWGGYPAKVDGKWRWKRVTNWEDNKLPERWWKYDNNVSMNGDGWGMILSDGTHTSRFSREEVDSGQTIPIPYTDPAYKGDSYYCKGHHPRSRLARYVWMGLRNRGSLYALEMGHSLDPFKPLEQWGVLNQGKEIDGVKVICCDGVWQLTETKKRGWIEINRNVGFKVNNARTGNVTKAAVTWSPFYFRIRP